MGVPGCTGEVHPGSALRVTLVALALQNLRRKPFRACALALAVAVGCGAVFATATLMLGVEQSLALGFSRLGADLLVVPKGTLVNIRAALLTGEPSPFYMGQGVLEEVLKLGGVSRAAPQLFVTSADAFCCVIANAFIVGFDPARDFTVLPWVTERLNRPMARDDVIVGGLVRHQPGDALYFYGQGLTVYGKLGRTGVGVYDNGFFMTLDRVHELAERSRNRSGVVPLPLERGKISAVLVQLAVDAKPEAVRFAIGRDPEVKVVVAGSLITSVRQTMVALSGGTLLLSAVLFVGNILMISAIFSTVVNERRRELGLLRAIGARKRTVFRLILTEALILTFGGGLLGVVLGVILLRLFERTIAFYLLSLNIPFLWPSVATVLLVGVSCLGLSLSIGALGALYPALTASKLEPYDLIRASE